MGQVMQDSVCYAIECAFYLQDNGGHGKVLTGGDVYLEVCFLWLLLKGWIREEECGD